MIIGEGLKAIHSQAFKGVTNVKLIAFPHDIYSIDSDAFDLDFYKGDGKVPIKADTLSGKIWKGIGNGDLYLNGVQKTHGSERSSTRSWSSRRNS